jgi:hypothetical protein
MAIATILMAFAALVVAILSAWNALREARIGNALPGALDFLGQYREGELIANREFVARHLPDWDPQEYGISNLPHYVQYTVTPASHYLDHLGVLVEHGLVDARMVAGSMGDSIIRQWNVLEPYIERERELRAGAALRECRKPEDYQWYFEKLAKRMREIGPAEARRRPRRWRWLSLRP